MEEKQRRHLGRTVTRRLLEAAATVGRRSFVAMMKAMFGPRREGEARRKRTARAVEEKQRRHLERTVTRRLLVAAATVGRRSFVAMMRAMFGPRREGGGRRKRTARAVKFEARGDPLWWECKAINQRLTGWGRPQGSSCCTAITHLSPWTSVTFAQPPETHRSHRCQCQRGQWPNQKSTANGRLKKCQFAHLCEAQL